MTYYTVTLDTVFHALADSTRRAVIERLVTGPAPIKELAAPFDMALPSFMKHIRVLEECGLIRSEKAGRVRTCEIRKEQLSAAEAWISQQRTLWNNRANRIAQHAEQLQAQEKNT